jgi:DNA polymerase
MSASVFDELYSGIKTCQHCELNNGYSLAVPGIGTTIKPDLFILAEAPGREESDPDLYKGKDFGTPLVGPAGQKLQTIMAAIGFAKYSMYVTNVLKHRPPNNRPPSQEEKHACIPWLLIQLAHTQPKTILALGRHASETLYNIYRPGETKPEKYQGLTYQTKESTIFNTYHPSYACLRNPSAEPIFTSDLWQLYKHLEVVYERNNS